MKVSFLVCAHNEEKVISQALDNLIKIDYSPKEIIVGLDGCTDRTEEIVKKYKKVRIFKGKERLGKSKLVEKLIHLSTGEILVIHDADWRFVSKPGYLKKMVQLFKDDPLLGGVDFPHPHPFIEKAEKSKKVKSILFIGSAWGSKLVTEFLWSNYSKKENGRNYVDGNKLQLPLPVGVFRKGIVKDFDIIHDDAVVCMEILRKGYKIMLLDRTYPYFVVTDQGATNNGIYKQKTRTSIGWRQVEKKYPTINMKLVYPKLLLYFLGRFFEIITFRAKIGFLLWLFISLVGTIKGKLIFNKFNTQQAWAFRTTRHGTKDQN